MSPHRFDPVAFVFGVVFAAVAVLGLTGPWTLQEVDLTWVGPGLLVLLGLAVLLTARPARTEPDTAGSPSAARTEAAAGAPSVPVDAAEAGGDPEPDDDRGSDDTEADQPDAGRGR